MNTVDLDISNHSNTNHSEKVKVKECEFRVGKSPL